MYRPLQWLSLGWGVGGVFIQVGVCLGDVCHTPPCGQRDICRNITLLQTSLADGNKRQMEFSQVHLFQFNLILYYCTSDHTELKTCCNQNLVTTGKGRK